MEYNSAATGKVSPPLHINLGIDFGTSFTKVSFRDLGTEQTGIVTFGADTTNHCLIPSLVAIDHRGFLNLTDGLDTNSTLAIVRYLKMRLGGLDSLGPVPRIQGVDFGEREITHALAAWFLAKIINRSRRWLLEHEHDRVAGRQIRWSANVGVPVAHYDSPALTDFKNVFAAAWGWVISGSFPQRVDEAIIAYRDADNDHENLDCHAIPEIAAAVRSFLVSRAAEPGIYIYFDIGGGTLDGVAFNFVNWEGTRRVNFFSGAIDSLGVEALVHKIYEKTGDELITAFKRGELPELVERHLEKNCVRSVQKLVAKVIVTAKKKDGSDWRQRNLAELMRPRKKLGVLEASDMTPLPVFMGGGAQNLDGIKKPSWEPMKSFNMRAYIYPLTRWHRSRSLKILI